MRKDLKEIAIFLSFLMLITSCYTYRQVPTSEKNILQVDDKVKIIADGVEYKYLEVTAVNDSTISFVQLRPDGGSLYFALNMNQIDQLYTYQKDNENTVIGIIGFIFLACEQIFSP